MHGISLLSKKNNQINSFGSKDFQYPEQRCFQITFSSSLITGYSSELARISTHAGVLKLTTGQILQWSPGVWNVWLLDFQITFLSKELIINGFK